MLISFIVPHYNLPKYLLQRCISSIVAQNTPVEDYEILIIDDGSYEPPMWIEKEYNQPNIRLILSKHGGLGAARNIGIKETSGKYIQFVDSDDCLISGSVNNCLEIIKKENPDIFQHSYRICLTEEETLKTATPTIETVTYYSGADYAARNNLNGSACTYIFKRELTNSHNISFAEGVLHEDEDFTLKIYYHSHKLICSNSPIYNYCIRQESITSNTDNTHEQKRIKDIFLLLKRVVTFRRQEQETCTLIQRKALDRKTAMLTVDTLLNLFYNGKSAEEIKKICNTELFSLGLYPLPTKNHSLKYLIFATLANNNIGIKILRTILPSRKPGKR
ncbi:MAG: glycosyltransferase [Bacteroidaceae bacterium]|nr:glycosyltransferase [Bacteroidaceae bacterium]